MHFLPVFFSRTNTGRQAMGDYRRAQRGWVLWPESLLLIQTLPIPAQDCRYLARQVRQRDAVAYQSDGDIRPREQCHTDLAWIVPGRIGDPIGPVAVHEQRIRPNPAWLIGSRGDCVVHPQRLQPGPCIRTRRMGPKSANQAMDRPAISPKLTSRREGLRKRVSAKAPSNVKAIYKTPNRPLALSNRPAGG
jgi:hypothetical protein